MSYNPAPTNPGITISTLRKMQASARKLLADGYADCDTSKILEKAARQHGFKHFGVEHLTCGRQQSNYCYLNTGETYEATVAYHEESDTFRVWAGGWGAVVERANAYLCSACGERPRRQGKSTCKNCEQYE